MSNCRHCGTLLQHTFLDLGYAPPSNAYLTVDDLNKPETYYPLKVKVCERCWLVQTEDFADAKALFSPDYAYFSSTSTTWLEHAKIYVNQIVEELSLDSKSNVIEVASNDGYLLRNFVTAGIPCLGIEPTDSTASFAEQLGIPVIREFFGEELGKRLANENKQADLIIGNNVLAHVPDINDFTRGLKAALKPDGVITLEFPHLMRLIEKNQFDTIYHEHFSYLSLTAVSKIFRLANLRIWKVEELSTHGGSLRVYGCHSEVTIDTDDSVTKLLQKEIQFGLQDLQTYLNFQHCADKIKNDLLAFLIEQKREGKSVAAYGAAAKGNTLLNYAGIKPDLLPFVCDASVAKQGKFMPGSHIPILHPNQIETAKLDFILILPWNIADEVQLQYSSLRDKCLKFITAVPSLRILL
ncbi:MAG: class I SAM-dependent methyltransferase [Balneolales bacterium]|nr:class I SAM-dependent methyltransferase [Balneolales bacterium]